MGQIVADRFKVISLLGEGGTGQVYLAEHLVLERKFAIKVLRRDMIQDAMAVERFRREARAASRMQHRNIVYISDFGTLPDGRLFLVMEYLPGDELRAVVQREGRLPPPRAARILMQVAEALDYAHEQGVVHRDLKSENILLTSERQKTDIVKILDFGLAKILFGAGNLETITAKGQLFGTPEYMAPEQIVGDGVDQRIDIYAMGVLAFEMLTGRTPFTGTLMELLVAHRRLPPPTASSTCPEAGIPAYFDTLIERCLRKEPAERFQHASELAELLRSELRPGRSAENLLSPEPLSAPPRSFTAGLPAGYVPTTGERRAVRSELRRFEPERAADLLWSALVADGPGVDDATRAERRRLLRQALQLLAQRCVARHVGTEEIGRARQRDIELEERRYELETELGLLESRFEAVETAGRESESQLRYAIIEISIERDRLLSVDGPTGDTGEMNADLTYQISELEHRLLDVARERETELDVVERDIAAVRRAADDLNAELTRADRDLLGLLVAQREAVQESDPTLTAAYAELDALLALPPGTRRSPG
jgi:tRNA A-37 threonylcarbamoyl transferase component Bud32